MRCWNCDYGLAGEQVLCPNCRAALPPARAMVPELLLAGAVAVGAGTGYAVAGWHGLAAGVFAGVPLGMFGIAVWHQRR